jgi:hypothetical protein
MALLVDPGAAAESITISASRCRMCSMRNVLDVQLNSGPQLVSARSRQQF